MRARWECTQTCMTQTENPSAAVYSSHALTAPCPAQFPALREFLDADKNGGLSVRGAHIDTCMSQAKNPPDAVSRERPCTARQRYRR